MLDGVQKNCWTRKPITVRLFAIAVALLLSHSAPALEDSPRTPRILIVGDSWAASITSENYDGIPAPDVFNEVLALNGFGHVSARGKVTARTGCTATALAGQQFLAVIRSELEAYPSIDIVHLIIGGNDFLARLDYGSLRDSNEESRKAVWNEITGNIRSIVRDCLAVRDDIRVVIADYDFLDIEAARVFWKNEYGALSNETVNTWLRELGDRKKQIADEIERCEYLEKWGTLQYWFGDPPQSVPLPGGDPAKGMPKSITPDGIHPNAQGHVRLLQNAVDAYYRDWLE